MSIDIEDKDVGLGNHAKNQLQMGCEYPLCWVEKDSVAQVWVECERVVYNHLLSPTVGKGSLLFAIPELDPLLHLEGESI